MQFTRLRLKDEDALTVITTARSTAGGTFRGIGIAQTTVRFSGSISWISISLCLLDCQRQDPPSVKRTYNSNKICGFEKPFKIVEIKRTLDRGKRISRTVR